MIKLSKLAMLGLAASLGLTATPMPLRAEPGGCLKYGAVGAVGGHLAHHGVLGAVGGCAAGMYTRHKYRKGVREKAQLYDQAHPPQPGQRRMSAAQKAKLYDQEQPQGASAAPSADSQPAKF